MAYGKPPTKPSQPVGQPFIPPELAPKKDEKSPKEVPIIEEVSVMEWRPSSKFIARALRRC